VNKDTRNKLRGVVTQCRTLLERAIGELLQGQFGIHLTGLIEDAGSLTHLSAEDREYRAQAVVHLEHIIASGFKPKDAVQQLVREVAFTHLNRLCAFKMMEERGLLEIGGKSRRAVSQGIKSQGFIFYLADYPDDEKLWRSGKQDVAYRHFLVWLGSTLADEIKALFSPNEPANRLFPPQRVLDQVLELINGDALEDICISPRRNCAIKRARKAPRRGTPMNWPSATSSTHPAMWSSSSPTTHSAASGMKCCEETRA
jgi:hypothetical protein